MYYIVSKISCTALAVLSSQNDDRDELGEVIHSQVARMHDVVIFS